MQTKIYTGSAVQQIDRLAIDEFGESGLSLMIKAGESAFAHIKTHLHAVLNANTNQQPTDPLSMVVLCGAGNNGGDGYVVARCALEAGWHVVLVACAAPKSDNAQIVAKQFLKHGGVVSTFVDLQEIRAFDVVVDALLGVGIVNAPNEIYAPFIRAANRLKGYKFAIDVPSGINADTGQVHRPSFVADFTLTFIAPKLGLLTGSAQNLVGELALESLNLDPAVLDRVPACATLLPKPDPVKRHKDSHKGNFGHVAIVGGDNGMLGAVLLAGKAALRCGSGKVHIMSTDAHLDKPALAVPELMSVVFEGVRTDLLRAADVLLIGPGLGLNDWGRHVFEVLIESDKPLVIDADALTMLAQTKLNSEHNNWVLTPHPGEAASLLKCSAADIQCDRLSAAKRIAKQYNCVCVLKGAGTLISDSAGSNSLCRLGNAGMATAGMGDVLSGMIASFVGQGLSIIQAAKAGVWLHSRAADRAIEEFAPASLIASDVIDRLPVSLREL